MFCCCKILLPIVVMEGSKLVSLVGAKVPLTGAASVLATAAFELLSPLPPSLLRLSDPLPLPLGGGGFGVVGPGGVCGPVPFEDSSSP